MTYGKGYAIYSDIPAAVDTIQCGDDLISYTAWQPFRIFIDFHWTRFCYISRDTTRIQ